MDRVSSDPALATRRAMPTLARCVLLLNLKVSLPALGMVSPWPEEGKGKGGGSWLQGAALKASHCEVEGAAARLEDDCRDLELNLLCCGARDDPGPPPALWGSIEQDRVIGVRSRLMIPCHCQCVSSIKCTMTRMCRLRQLHV
jgi:hypothetical protein